MTEPENPLARLAEKVNPLPRGRLGGRPKGSKNLTPEEKRIKQLSEKLPPESTKAAKVLATKTAIIQLLETRQAENLSDAADMLGISKLQTYRWQRNDLEWAATVKAAGEIIADRLENELLASEVNGKPISMPYVLARMFRLKAIRPALYKEKYPINVEDSKMVDLLNEIKKIGQKPAITVSKPEQEQGKESFIAVPVLEI